MNAVAKQKENRPVREERNGGEAHRIDRGTGYSNERDRERGYLQPPVNVMETKDGYILEAEMPGVGKDGLEVLLEGNELTIVGRRRNTVEGANPVYIESVDRDFRRTFVLDPAIDTAKINARMEGGVLTLNLPKAEKVKPRKITVE